MTAIELAAIASAAVPGLNVTAFGPEPDHAADFCSALLVDSENRRWRVRSPRHAEASARLETERQVLRAFTPAIRAELPFLLPTVAGTVRQGELITFVYSHIAGKAYTVDQLAAGSATLAMEIGAAIAAIHDLPQELVTNYDLPSYTANEFRHRKLNELDQSATTGKIPPALLRRWEHAMEDVALWRFNACVVHGDLHEDNILLDGDQVTAVNGWTELRVGDPADDFAWLVAVDDPDFVDTVLQAYAGARQETPDPHLLRRAALSAEFALAQWLVKGYAADSARMVEDAESMLRTLEADIAEHGGQPISVEPAASQPAQPAPQPTQLAQPAQPAPQRTQPARPAEPVRPVVEAVVEPAADPEQEAVAVPEPAATPAAKAKSTQTPVDADDSPAADAVVSPEDVDTTALKVIAVKIPQEAKDSKVTHETEGTD
ncbi:macrolide 2'-phosphotransferase [Arthrobacter psychrochitiniphilus]|uniref:Aminoglycoside phosphotransferase n=1 Tax=Arthrobacter psychrochitiniphilus TaxID=291045 RepID=A0A2V3DNH7_9MICC|nr:macrolide 2'-phosphotransferase [Arthrobacter psychrochitiniphilus]NYG18436.1 aminoglycoside phosphotransferase (APT) family kinase protein [Arthrobacter psychrochitiniphilus]PXA64532.1 aminoglycoside phosphotransferase [Arthrobacter psychrochitiniphilus]